MPSTATQVYIEEIGDGMKRIFTEGVIAALGSTRTVNLKDGNTAKVTSAELEDQTGKITLTLWDGDGERVSLGNRVRVHNGYATSFRGQIQLNIGRFGRLEVMG